MAVLQLAADPNSALPQTPRVIDPAQSFDALVAWVRELAVAKNVPGLIMGISGTDSIVTFLACAKAFEQLGKAHRVVGVYYGMQFPPPNKTPEQIEKIVGFNPSYNYVARVVVPWLQEQVPTASLFVDSSIDYHDDYQRWADLMKRALNGALKTEPLPAGENYWVVGTRNATEAALGSYSNISGAVSVQPLINLWKSEVMQICALLNGPKVVVERSRQVDCDCGRFDIAAHHIEAVDAVLMGRQGLLAPNYLQNPQFLDRLKNSEHPL